MRKNSFSTAGAAGYFVFFLVGLIYLSSTTLSFDTLRAALPTIAGLNDSAISTAITVYMIVGAAMILVKGVQSLIGLGVLGLPCIIADLAYIALHLILFSGAGTGASILLIFFIILSASSLVANIASLGGK